jgi:hypothetical protein
MNDWNYFLSAFAKSGAAIIGIVGAFTIAKIVAEQQDDDECEYEKSTYLDKSNDEQERQRWLNELRFHFAKHKRTYKPLMFAIVFVMIGVIFLVLLPLCFLPIIDLTDSKL